MLAPLLLMITGTASGALAYRRCRRYRADSHPAALAVTLIGVGTAGGVLIATATVAPLTRIVLAHLVVTCLPLTAVDALTGRLPRGQVFAVYPSTGAIVSFAVWRSGSATMGVGAAVSAAGVWLLFLILAMFGGMGAGDVRLAPVLGAHLGHAGVLFALNGIAYSFVLGALAVLALAATKRLSPDHRIPFGPALLGGTILALIS